ncbi:MAG TPA: 2-amino-4-hydroxy-6-hydroxymethyldihydropteridine diphosphokinase [Thermoanaerobaculia bacterium]|nr:2-amino-4-hydroxy-6-hydroxymethyldihydropteridine diphosphokinase [Thermoanaerobaculia bacterium]
MTPVVIALGSNLGDRRLHLRRAIARINNFVNLHRLSSVWETVPVDAPAGSGSFLNMVAAGSTTLSAGVLLDSLHEVERGMGRVRRRLNEPRIIDLDLIFFGAQISRSKTLDLPHPRYANRSFVLQPLAELALPWIDPRSGAALDSLPAAGEGRSQGGLYDSFARRSRFGASTPA